MVYAENRKWTLSTSPDLVCQTTLESKGLDMASSLHDPDALFMLDAQGLANAPSLATDPTLYTNRSTLYQILKPVPAENIGKPPRIQNSFYLDRLLCMARDFHTGNEVEHTNRIDPHPQPQPAVLDLDLVSVGVVKADVDAHHRLLIPQ